MYTLYLKLNRKVGRLEGWAHLCLLVLIVEEQFKNNCFTDMNLCINSISRYMISNKHDDNNILFSVLMYQYHCVCLHAIEIPTHDISIFTMAKHLFTVDQNLTRKHKAQKYNLKIILAYMKIHNFCLQVKRVKLLNDRQKTVDMIAFNNK